MGQKAAGKKRPIWTDEHKAGVMKVIEKCKEDGQSITKAGLAAKLSIGAGSLRYILNKDEELNAEYLKVAPQK